MKNQTFNKNLKKKKSYKHNTTNLTYTSSNEAIDNVDITFHWHTGTVTL